MSITPPNKTVINLSLAILVLLSGCSPHFIREDTDRIRLFLKAPGARQVELLASFNGFSPLPALHEFDGLWEVDVPPLATFAYTYRVDGHIRLPECREKEKDDFGQFNCVFQKAP